MNYLDIDVWQKSDALAANVRENAKRFYDFNLGMKAYHIASAIPAVIKDAYAKEDGSQFIWNLQMALSLLDELERTFPLAKALNFLTDELYCSRQRDIAEIKHRLIAQIEQAATGNYVA